MTNKDAGKTTGVDDKLRAALLAVADEVGAKTALPVVVPVKQIMAAMHTVLDDVPRIPAPDPRLTDSVEVMLWDAPQPYSPYEVPETEPERICLAVEGDQVGIILHSDGQHHVIALPPATARDFFLNGLAACLVAEQQERERLAEMAKQPLDLSAIPAEVFEQGQKIDRD